MGADIVRWLFCAQPPSQNINFGYGPADEVKRRLLTLWNSVGFLMTYANIAEWRQPEWGAEPSSQQPLDRWLVARTGRLVSDAEAAYERYATPALTSVFEGFVDDLSNWYIRRSRRRFWNGDAEALQTLWWSAVQALRVVAPAMPFLADHLWRMLVLDGPDSVHLAGWPDVAESDQALLDEIAAVRRVVELGRQARSQSGIKLRQPLRRLVVQGADGVSAHVNEIAEELSVKEVEFGDVDASELRVKPNLPVLGPKLGKELGAVRRALESGEFEELDGGRFQVDGHVLEPEEVLVERVGLDGWAVASEHGVTVALDTALDNELLLEARLLDRIHEVNVLRKQSGLEITDRINLRLPDADLIERYGDRIAAETLAVSLEAGDLAIEKA
jgi:isoleucyl-tRNA synthetase